MHDFFNIGRRALKFGSYIENKKNLICIWTHPVFFRKNELFKENRI